MNFRNIIETDDIRYLLMTLRRVAAAKGWATLARETGLARSVLYAALSGDRDPQISTVMKILKALGVHVISNIVPLHDSKKPMSRTTTTTKKKTKEVAYG